MRTSSLDSTYRTIPLVHCLFAAQNIMYAGTGTGVYRFSAKENAWALFGLESVAIRSLAAIGNRLFAGRYEGGVSRLSAASWSPVMGSAHYYTTMASARGRLFAGGLDGVDQSADKGATWSGFSTGIGESTSIMVLVTIGPYLVGGTEVYGIWRRPLADAGTGFVPHDVPAKARTSRPSGRYQVVGFRLGSGSGTGEAAVDAEGKRITEVR